MHFKFQKNKFWPYKGHLIYICVSLRNTLKIFHNSSNKHRIDMIKYKILGFSLNIIVIFGNNMQGRRVSWVCWIAIVTIILKVGKYYLCGIVGNVLAFYLGTPGFESQQSLAFSINKNSFNPPRNSHRPLQLVYLLATYQHTMRHRGKVRLVDSWMRNVNNQ